MIRHEGGKYVVLSEEGKRLGEYPTEESAKKRLKQIEFWKGVGKKLKEHP